MTTAIGQGNTLVTPLHMAMIAACVANAGTMMQDLRPVEKSVAPAAAAQEPVMSAAPAAALPLPATQTAEQAPATPADTATTRATSEQPQPAAPSTENNENPATPAATEQPAPETNVNTEKAQ